MEFMKHLVRADDPGDVLTGWMSEYGRDVWNYAYVIARSADAADEIAQDTFAQPHRRFTTLNESFNYISEVQDIPRIAIEYRGICRINACNMAFIRLFLSGDDYAYKKG